MSGKIAELMELYRTGELSGTVVFPEVKKLEGEQRSLKSHFVRFVQAEVIIHLYGESDQ